MASSEKFCLRWNDFENNISVAFRELREEKDFFDVTLACDDSQIQAHKVILSACSPFFRNVLRRNPHQHPLLYLKGVKYKELLCVLNFMYQGEVNVAQEELNSFLAVAEDLRVKGLTQNDSTGDTKPKTDTPKVSRLPPRDPPPKEPVPPPKRSRPDPPPPVNTYQHEEDDDIQEVVPVKSEPRDTTTTMSNIDTPVYSQPQPATHQPSPAPQHVIGGQDGALALDDSYADESYDYGQYEEGGYEDGTGMIDPNTGMPIQGGGGADGNKGGKLVWGQSSLYIEVPTFSQDWDSQVSSRLLKRDGVYFCSDCSFSSAKKPNTVSHIQARHLLNFEGYKCSVCGSVAGTLRGFDTHLSRAHNTSLSKHFNLLDNIVANEAI